MGLFGQRNKKKNASSEQETFVAIDIGTETIKTVLFRIIRQEIQVIGYNRLPQARATMSKAIILDMEQVAEAIDTSIGLALRHAEKKITEIHLPKKAIIGIAGELVSGIPVEVSVERDKPDEGITEKEIMTVLERVKEYTFHSAKEEIAEDLGLDVDQLEELETVVNSISIDGVRSQSPIGLSGKNLQYRVFSSFAPRVQIETIESIADRLELHLRAVPVEPYALARGVPEVSNADEGAIIIDIGAGTTDVVVTQNGNVLGLTMYAIGGRTFTKRIQKELLVSYEEAETMKRAYVDETLDAYQTKEIHAALQQDIETWLLGLELALAEIDDIETYPRTMYLCGGGALLPDIKDGIQEHPWIQRLQFRKHPSIQFLYPNKVANVTDATRSMTTLIDVMPLALARTMVRR